MERRSAVLNLEAALAPYIQQIDDELKKHLAPMEPEDLNGAVKHLFTAGGKRLRPVVALVSAQAVGGESSLVLPYSAAIEMLHTFTLIHDDIMDKAQTRRGQPSVHAKWGESTAILAGDLLLALSFDALTKVKSSPDLFKELVKDFSQITREICEGQQWDVKFETTKRVDEMAYFHMVERKTATLYEMAMRHGALIAGGDPVAARKVAEAGRLIGLAFQVWDDCLDLVGDPAKTGKPTGLDVFNGKKTLVVVFAMERLDPLDRRKLMDLIAKKEKTQDEMAQIHKFFEKSKAIQLAQDKARSFSSHAKACLAVLPASNARNLLNEIADFAVNRDR